MLHSLAIMFLPNYWAQWLATGEKGVLKLLYLDDGIAAFKGKDMALEDSKHV